MLEGDLAVAGVDDDRVAGLELAPEELLLQACVLERLNMDEATATLKKAIQSSRIRAGAFGETRSKCAQATEACWHEDRRVEVLVRPGQ